MSGTLFVIDGHSFIYHSFFGMPPLTNSTGDQVQAAYSLVQLLLRLATREGATHWAIAFDTSAPTFRHERYEAYKADRPEMPEPLRRQLPWIEELLAGFGIPVLRLDGFEADDLVCTLATAGEQAGLDVRLISKDKDLEQILSPRVKVWDPKDGSVYGPEELARKKGITPEQVIDYQALVGDPSDNIPGVSGVGPKTAQKVLAAVDDLEALLVDPPPAGIPPRTLEKIRAHAQEMRLSRELARLHRDAPVPRDLDGYRRTPPDAGALRPLLEQLGFRKFIDELEEIAGPGDGAGGGPGDRSGPATAPPTTRPAPPARPVREPEALRALAGRWQAGMEAVLVAVASPGPTREARLRALALWLPGPEDSSAPGEVAVIPVGGRGGIPTAELAEILGPALADPERPVVAHDLKRLHLLLANEGLILAGGRFDPMLAAYLLNPLRRGYGLPALAGELLGVSLAAIETGEPDSGALLPEAESEQLAAHAAAVAALAERLRPEVERAGVRRVLEELELPLSAVLAAMEHEGVTLDLLRLQELEDELSRTVDRLARDIQREAGREFNINSPRQLETVLFDECDFPSLRKIKTGRSTSADVLEELSVRFPERPLPRLLLEYRSLTKLLGTYVQALPRLVRPSTGRLHTDFSQVTAATGRLASSDPNLQNIPVKTDLGRRIRRAFIPNHPGELFLSADYSQVELRLLAHLSGDEALCAALTGGADIHREVAARIHGKPAADVTPAERTAAKAVNFGVIYGMGAFGLSRDLGIPRAEAKEFIERFFAEFPGVRAFIDATIETARRTGEVRTLYGRRRPIPDIDARTPHRRQQAERFAVNTVVQGSAADLIKKAMVAVHRALIESDSPARLLLQIHDELLLAVPRDRLEPEGQRVRELMEGVLELCVPLVVTLSTGEDWYEASK